MAASGKGVAVGRVVDVRGCMAELMAGKGAEG